MKNLQEIFGRPFDRTVWQSVLTDIFGVTEIRREPRQLENESNDKVDGFEVGRLNTSDGFRIGIYEFEIKSGHKIAMNRVGLRGLVRGLVKYHDDAALVVFYNKDAWRLSFVCDLRDEKTAPKRFTYVFGNSADSYRTPANNFAALVPGNMTFEAIRTAFSVEALNKEFFKGYKELFRKFADKLSEGREQTKQDRDYVKKLLGRLVFLQFLQKKGWMGVPAANKDWTGGDPNYLQNLIAGNRTENILTDVLEPLFFATLNERRDGDLADPRLGENVKIPYLNGGLFDKDTLDEQKIDFPYEMFKELSDFFSAYNFTIDENDPDDSEVGIDPEMLGHIFENLLEDNKDKGAFYTPKEIVHYMCRESLMQYLRPHADAAVVEKLVRDNVFVGSAEDAALLNNLLREVKICDPAIGSGAFPMGLLAEILRCRTHLLAGQKTFLSSAGIKREIIQENIYGVDIEQGAVDIARLRFWLSLVVDEPQPEPLPNLDYKIMQGNSLLESFAGLKLENIGEIHKKHSSTDLFSVDTDASFSEDIDFLMDSYFSTTDHNIKSDWRNRIESQVKERIGYSIKQQLQAKHDSIEAMRRQLTENSPLSKHKAIETLENEYAELCTKATELNHINEGNRPYFLWHTYFKDVFDRDGFDIIIGNPPFIQLQKNGGELSKLFGSRKEGRVNIPSPFRTFDSMGDIYSLFYEQGYNVLRSGGVLCFITSNKWMRAGYGENTRRFFVENTNPVLLVDLGAGIFESATVDTNILIFKKEDNQHRTAACTLLKEHVQDLGTAVRSRSTVCSFGVDSWVVLSPIEQSIKAKIEAVGTPLREWDIQINYGIKTGFNDAFIISGEKRNELIAEDPKSEEIIRPLLRGRDIKRYGYEYADKYLLFIPWHFPLHKDNSIVGSSLEAEQAFSTQYPAVYNHLSQYKDELSNRNKAETGIRYEWYALQRWGANYWEDFYKQKIIFQEMVQEPSFILDNDGTFFCLDTGRIITGKDIQYLIAVLNSKLFFFAVKYFYGGGGLGDTGIRMKHTFFEKFSCPSFNDATKQKIEKSLIHKAYDAVDTLIYALYGINNEEIEFIESR